MQTEMISPAESARNEIMSSPLGEQYKVKENITEIWADKSGALCVRINKIFYDIIMKTPDGKFAVVKEALSNKPSSLSVVLGRVVEGESGEGVMKYDWEKLSEDVKLPSQRNLMTGDYKTADSSFQVRWEDDMILAVSRENNVFLKITNGPLNEEQAKVLKSAVDAYILRCNKKLNPQEPKQRKPREKKIPSVTVETGATNPAR